MKPIRLSPRENEVMQLVIQGYTCKMIGRELGISESGARTQTFRVIRKMGARNTTHAVVLAIKSNLLTV